MYRQTLQTGRRMYRQRPLPPRGYDFQKDSVPNLEGINLVFTGYAVDETVNSGVIPRARGRCL